MKLRERDQGRQDVKRIMDLEVRKMDTRTRQTKKKEGDIELSDQDTQL